MDAKKINRQILRLAIPSIMANITVPLVGIVDLAISGHIGDAVSMGGIAIGSMLFDLLYWNMGFLRVGTGGLTAQAFGRRDWKSAGETFAQGIMTAWAVALICLAIQWLYIYVAFMLVDCSPQAAVIAKEYFFIRIWAVPATLSLFVFKGWFIGMQNTVFAMIVDIWVNVVNMVASWYLAFHTSLGIKGIAVGTLVAQWTGFLLAGTLLLFKYRAVVALANLRQCARWKRIRAFFSLNIDLFVRSLSMLVVYTGFTVLAARFGDTQLAVSTVMMKMLLLYSYFVDGFAYAGEALAGRYIGAQDTRSLHLTIKWIFVWCFIISALSTFLYAVIPRGMIALITDDLQVRAACEPFLFWLLLMPVVSCIAFTWDGIYIGATASVPLRNSTILAAVVFVLSYLIFKGPFGVQSIYIGYFVHLVARSAYLTLVVRKNIWSRVPALDGGVR